MYSVWLSVKENMNCGVRTPEVYMPRKVKGRKCGTKTVSPARELLPESGYPEDDIIFRWKYGRERFCELDIGDASRNIVEMIFQAASMRPGKCVKKVEKVLKVRNSPETLERFEDYREMVKRRARFLHKMHPRSIVDGNELLRFYVTTMRCCLRKTTKVSKLCWDLTCGVCRIIRLGFESEEMRRDGIPLKASSNISDDEMVLKEVENGKRAVVVCRVIAGKAVSMVEGGRDEGFDAVDSSGELYAKFDHLFVKNPSAVLPCFVIICS
ncbi:uncharacterized protein LOC143881569 [Tasmannia lanceolata]|uniref:uncharacterized protein LOC143881569 n=1 Tax=Tasmannia lanceolata TaxID=3420 RepID=UPI0040638B50